MATLPTEPDPFDLALVNLLMGMSGSWQKPNLDSFTHTQEGALSRMIQAGIVEARLDLTATMRGFPKRARMHCRVTGRYERLVHKQLFEQVPEWLTADGKTRGYLAVHAGFRGVRLTRDGELAQTDGRQGDFSYYLLFVRGHGPIKHKYGAGYCGVERFWIEANSTGAPDSTPIGPNAVANASASVGDIAVHNQVNVAPQVVVNINGATLVPSAQPMTDGKSPDQAAGNAGSIRPTDKPDEGEGIGGAGSAPGQEQSPPAPTRESVLRQLEPAVRRAYQAYQYAEGYAERQLEDREAYEWLRENGIDQGKGDLDELTDYELPDSLETFRRYLGTARRSLGENKYTRRRGRKHGRSVARGNEVEYQKGEGR